jgi:hypothetical protein
MDHDDAGRVYMLRTMPTEGVQTTGVLSVYDVRWIKTGTLENSPLAMAVDQKKALVYIFMGNLQADNPSAPPAIDVFDGRTLNAQRTFGLAQPSITDAFLLDSKGDIVMSPVYKTPVVIRPSDGKAVRTLPFPAVAMTSGGDGLFYVLQGFGDLTAYDPNGFRAVAHRSLLSPQVRKDGFENRFDRIPKIAVDAHGTVYLANPRTNELLMYKVGATSPIQMSASSIVMDLQLDESGNVYVLIGDPQHSGVPQRLDLYNDGTGALVRSYPFEDRTYAFRMTVVPAQSSGRAP